MSLLARFRRVRAAIRAFGLCPLGRAVLGVLVVMALTASDSSACGRDSDCVIGERSYRIILPPGAGSDHPVGAIVFVHGYRGNAAGVVGNPELAALAPVLGVALIAAQAAGPEWNIPHVPSDDALPGVDELAYFDALAADLADRFHIDTGRIMVTGFSSGAMMVWHLACHRGDVFAGFAPMSGTFWVPLPDSCPAPAGTLIHYHGRDDPVVPLHGRPIKDGRQGDVGEALALVSGSEGFRAEPVAADGDLDCVRHAGETTRLIELCLFTGAHDLRPANIARAARLIGIAARDD
ncbi:polyhydroxybutyrate depolymerase [Limibaculum sp. FT325]|uniref:alpha/beta hydrolase family esterase n=1 Tax=Thermohalobaculum sediminis TaxID=2939436 RepID=UPI0020BF4E72|nr:PHB depolymerase family esterase [Limibaculum sediminis]MCL5775605.1 polyhydroxybutyrate depolymerase [Limibaculum sediminis]